jgi:hypothetical protein
MVQGNVINVRIAGCQYQTGRTAPVFLLEMRQA